VKEHTDLEKILEKMAKEFCPFCEYFWENLDEEGEKCPFSEICTKSLCLLNKRKPLYFKRSE